MTSRQIPQEEEVLGYMTSLSNWGRWGPDDELGTLNLITPAKRAQAGSLVREGISVTCSRLIVPEGAAAVSKSQASSRDFTATDPHIREILY